MNESWFQAELREHDGCPWAFCYPQFWLNGQPVYDCEEAVVAEAFTCPGCGLPVEVCEYTSTKVQVAA